MNKREGNEINFCKWSLTPRIHTQVIIEQNKKKKHKYINNSKLQFLVYNSHTKTAAVLVLETFVNMYCILKYSSWAIC